MTAREMSEAIGKPVFYVAGALKFTCMVKDVKIGYGQPRFLIVPMNGVGERWVEFSSIEPIPVDVMKVILPYYKPQENKNISSNSQRNQLTPGVTRAMIGSR